MKEWSVVFKTIGENLFTLRLWAKTQGEAKTKAKKLTQGCSIIGEPQETKNKNI